MSAPARSTRPPRPRSRPGRRRRRWGLRIALFVACLVLAVSAIGHLLVRELESGIHRVDAFGGLDNRPRSAGGGVNFLVVGTDGRDRITPQEKVLYRLGGAPCHCTDTIILVHLSADRRRASVVSLPRDSYAMIPAYTDRTGKPHSAHPQRLNAAYAEGGPSLTVRTVEHATGVHIDHYLEVDFTSFMKTVDVVGGVKVCTARRLKDDHTGLDLPSGSHVLNGGQALQYVRSRHTDGTSDLGRIQRQQRFLASVLHQTTAGGILLNPVRFNAVATTLLGSVRADSGFGAEDLMALGRAMNGLTPASSEFASVPVILPGKPLKGVGSTLHWDRPRADLLFDAIRQDRPLTRHHARPKATVVDVAPQQVRVHVLNGTGTAGLARRADRALHATGFATTGSPADAATKDLARTVITYDPVWNRSVRTLAAALPGAQLKPVPGQGGVMQVTVGADYKDVHPVRTEDPRRDRPGIAAVTGDEVACA
ncbi:putative membrane protein [Streptomyces himastatinicus ATCC 53653]|uniref:Putative membrane protein n=1 Tax=Streptomyces himastatinicus ATCC 53653 TaxID=457427 RepID=D9WIN1_9ACTN|nr:LCP family protein [Streptomyces himastatinicus]EFL25589.1 putative membrane protein [Streptomyces himastatinicus ATCC 53653]